MGLFNDIVNGINKGAEHIFGNPFKVIANQLDDGYQFGDVGRGIVEYIGGTGGQENSPLTGLVGEVDSLLSSANKEGTLANTVVDTVKNAGDTIVNNVGNAADNIGVPEERYEDPNINPEIGTPVELNQDLIDYYDRILDRNDARVEAQNEFNALEAQKNRDFQAQMSNTAYQRAVEDMKKAGINPMMAFSQGGASTPSGSSATSTYSAMSAPSPVSGIDVGNLSVSQISNLIADANLSMEQERFIIDKLSDMLSSGVKIAGLLL